MSDRVEADPSGRAIDPGEYAAKEATWAYSGRDETLQPIRYLDGLDEAFARDWLGGSATVEDIHDLAQERGDNRKRERYGLTGEGFTIEEATELLEGYQPPEVPQERRQEYLEKLEQAARRWRAELAEAEKAQAALDERNGAARPADAPLTEPSVPVQPVLNVPMSTDSPR